MINNVFEQITKMLEVERDKHIQEFSERMHEHCQAKYTAKAAKADIQFAKCEDYLADTVQAFDRHMKARELGDVCVEVNTMWNMRRNMKKFHNKLSQIEKQASQCENEYNFRFNWRGFERDLTQLFKHNVKL